jgi:hypothetical protein
MEILNRIASELLDKEVLNAAELDVIIGISPAPDAASHPVLEVSA